MSKLKIFNKRLVKNEVITDNHWLMRHDSGSIFLVKLIDKTYHLCCLNKGFHDEGRYKTGFVMKKKSIAGFTKMQAGFYIEIEQS